MSLTLKYHPPFGSVMPGREYSNGAYRFGFNGKEQDGSTFEGCIAFEARIFDGRLGRYFSTDPREYEYQWQSTYVYFKNSPISQLDYLGMGGGKSSTKEYTIQKGDWLSKIAKKEKTTVDRIMELNPQIKDKNKIEVGQKIKLDNKEVESQAGTGFSTKTNDNSNSDGNIAKKLADDALGINQNSNTNSNASTNTPDKSSTDANSSPSKPFNSGLDFLGGLAGGLELGFKIDAKSNIKYAQRIDGKVRSAATLTRANQISSSSASRVFGFASKAIGLYSAADAGMKLVDNPSNPANWVKFGASTGLLFLKANPLTFALSVGYTIANESGLIDKVVGK